MILGILSYKRLRGTLGVHPPPIVVGDDFQSRIEERGPPVSQWNLDDDAAVADDLKNVQDGTINGTGWIRDDGPIVRFDGPHCINSPATSGSYIEIPHNAALKTAAATILVFGQHETLAQKSTLLACDGNAATEGAGFAVEVTDAGEQRAFYNSGSGGAGGNYTIFVRSDATIALRRAYCHVLRFGPAGLAINLFNEDGMVGAKQHYPAITSGLAGNTSPIRLCAWHSPAAGQSFHDGPIGPVVWFNTYLEDAELESICVPLTLWEAAPVADNFSVIAGSGVTPFDVQANDTLLIGDETTEIVPGSFSGDGSIALNADGKRVNYTAPGSAGSASFEYNLRRVNQSGPAVLVNVTVNTGGGGGGNFSGPTTLQSARAGDNLTSVGGIQIQSQEPLFFALPEDMTLPAASNTLNATPANFDSVYGSAAAGDHIVLGNGAYGTKTLDRDFPINNRIVLRAANRLQATFTQITVSGNGHIISGVAVDTGNINTTAALTITSANSVRVTRSRIRNGHSVVRVTSGSQDALIDHCELSHYCWRGCFVTSTPPTPCKRPIFARNWTHNGLNTGQGPDGQLLSLFAFGSTNSDGDRQGLVEAIVRYNYCQSHNFNDYVHNKSSGNRYESNRFVVVSGASNQTDNRTGVGTKFIGNDCSGMQLGLSDYDCYAFGNKASEIRVRGGNSELYTETTDEVTWNGQVGEVAIQYACRRARVANNEAPVLIGAAVQSWCNQQPTKCSAPEIYSNSQAPTFQPNLTGGACGGFVWYENVTNNWQQQPPGSWGADALATPDIASALRPGDHTTPDVGPFRATGGGLL